MSYLDLLQEYLSNLGILIVKLHNIHWNVIGNQFLRIHTFTEEMYDGVFKNYDEVAELLKMKSIMPLSTMAEYLDKASIKEIKAKDFSVKESLTIIKEDLATMKKLAINIRNSADQEDDFETVAIFEGYVANFSKNLWFVETMLR